jgi:hypothetical protein
MPRSICFSACIGYRIDHISHRIHDGIDRAADCAGDCIAYITEKVTDIIQKSVMRNIQIRNRDAFLTNELAGARQPERDVSKCTGISFTVGHQKIPHEHAPLSRGKETHGVDYSPAVTRLFRCVQYGPTVRFGSSGDNVEKAADLIICLQRFCESHRKLLRLCAVRC